MNYPHRAMSQEQHHTQSLDDIPRRGHASAMASRSTSFDRRTRPDVDSWIDVSSQPSSSSLSSIGDEIVTTGLRIQSNKRTGERRTVRLGAPTALNITLTRSTSSQEEYEESESESDRIMQSSGDEPMIRMQAYRHDSMDDVNTTAASGAGGPIISDDEDENRTAINYPINNATTSFTPLPNAFSHPPSTMNRTTSQPVHGSYFPASRPSNSRRPSGRYSLPPYSETRRPSHIAQNPLSPSFNAAAEHEEVLRASLTSLLSVAAAARSLPKSDTKRPSTTQQPPRSNRIDPMSFRLVPESALQNPSPSPAPQQEPTFKPTLRRTSTASASASTTSSHPEHKRKAPSAPGASATLTRPSSRERRSIKKARRSPTSISHHHHQEDLHITPTLLTWFVSAGVVIVFSALSFTAGYGLGKEAGRLEAGSLAADEGVRNCAREAGRSGLGLRRSLASRAVMV